MTRSCKNIPIRLIDDDSERLDLMSRSLKLSIELGPLVEPLSCSENSAECLAELNGPNAP